LENKKGEAGKKPLVRGPTPPKPRGAPLIGKVPRAPYPPTGYQGRGKAQTSPTKRVEKIRVNFKG